MGIWNFYFIAKLFLFSGRYIDFHVFPNLAFACLLVIPIRHTRLKLLRQIIAVPVAIALFYYDTWLPPISRLLSQASLLQGFSLTYMAELAGRFISPLAIAGLIVLFIAYYFANKKIQRITPFVFAAMLVPLLITFATPAPVKKLEIAIPSNDVPTTSADTGATGSADARMAAKTESVMASPVTSDVPLDSVVSLKAEKLLTEPKKSSAIRAKTESAKSEPAKLPLNAEPPASVANIVSGPSTEATLTASLNAFYRDEAARKVTFSPKVSDAPFDIIFLQVCSLSWDDLDFTKERGNPLLKRFNMVFTNFNSAATYSGPSGIRVLRGSCGQTRHGALYDAFSPQCLTFNNLQQVGFEPHFAMNHDGRFGGFINDIRDRGGMKATPLDTKGAAPYLKSFDGSPIQNDYAILSKWWEKRLQTPAARVALFYNSVSLHDGNRYADGRPGNSMEIYHPRLTRLLGDVDRFIAEVQASGRRAIIVFIPEHGAALRGDKIQIAGMREIPSPRISLVPVGIKLIGLSEAPATAPLIVSKPVSYLAISQLLADFIRTTPFGNSNLSLDRYARDLPSTEFVSENNDLIVMRRGKQFFIRSKDAGWSEFDPAE